MSAPPESPAACSASLKFCLKSQSNLYRAPQNSSAIVLDKSPALGIICSRQLCRDAAENTGLGNRALLQQRAHLSSSSRLRASTAVCRLYASTRPALSQKRATCADSSTFRRRTWQGTLSKLPPQHYSGGCKYNMPGVRLPFWYWCLGAAAPWISTHM